MFIQGVTTCCALNLQPCIRFSRDNTLICEKIVDFRAIGDIMLDLRFLSFFSALMLFWQFFRQRTIKSPMSAPFLDFRNLPDFCRFRRFFGLERRILRNLRFCRQSRVPPWFSKKIEIARSFWMELFRFFVKILPKSRFCRKNPAFSFRPWLPLEKTEMEEFGGFF